MYHFSWRLRLLDRMGRAWVLSLLVLGGILPLAAEDSRLASLRRFEERFQKERDRLLADSRLALERFMREQQQELQRLAHDQTLKDGDELDRRFAEDIIARIASAKLVIEVKGTVDSALVTPWNSVIPDHRAVRRIVADAARLDDLGRMLVLARLDAQLVRKQSDPDAAARLLAFGDAARGIVIAYYRDLDVPEKRPGALQAARTALQTAFDQHRGNRQTIGIYEEIGRIVIGSLANIDSTTANHAEDIRLLNTLLDTNPIKDPP